LRLGEVWWANLGPYRLRERTGRRPVVMWQSDTLTRALSAILQVPRLTPVIIPPWGKRGPQRGKRPEAATRPASGPS
jgi:mRNA-degrading endonuclease toxin of MazEF toxin-antitoxin module